MAASIANIVPPFDANTPSKYAQVESILGNDNVAYADVSHACLKSA
jgi:hypothetical protein